MAGRKQTSKINNTIKIKCGICNREKGLRNFYASNKGEYKIAYQGKAPFCSDCLKSAIYDESGQVDRDKFINVLVKLDKPMIPSLYGEVLLNEKDVLSTYISRLNLKNEWKSLSYADSFRFNDILNSNIKQNNDNSMDISKIDVEITDEDLEIQKDVIKLLGYDPLASYEKFDKKVMYGELLPYLDEETLEDQFKISVIIQIINNNNQIRKIDLVINKLSSDVESLIKNSKDIDQLTATKNRLTQSNDKLSKENSIALKHRGDKKAGKSTLGALMKQLRELDFDEAEEDFYDMQTAYGMKKVADISNKSILEQLNFDEKDIDDMFKMQREYIQKLQIEKTDLEEKLRQANEKIISLEQKDLKEV